MSFHEWEEIEFVICTQRLDLYNSKKIKEPPHLNKWAPTFASSSGLFTLVNLGAMSSNWKWNVPC